MTEIKQKRALPEKVMHRHMVMLNELVPSLARLVIEEKLPADVVLSKHLRTHKELGSRDRRFLSQAIFSYFRWYGWVVNKLHLSVSEACLLSAALDFTTLSESFQYLEKQCKLPCPITPLGECSLEEKRDYLNDWFKNREDFQRLELADLFFPGFDRVIATDKVNDCIKSFQKRPPAWMRVRSSEKKLERVLKEKEIPYRVHPKREESLSIPGGIAFAHILAPQAAQFVVQDISSQCVGWVCDPQENGDWWDACAGAGGKSIHLADLMNQTGKVLATDIRVPALKELKKRARKYGIKGIRSQPFNVVRDEPFTKTFDGVLVDAPCSGWGTWARNPDARWRSSRRDVIQCATRQLKILNNSKWCVKKGGVLVYAVCTCTQPETEEVVMNFLEQNPTFKLDPFPHPLTQEPTNGQVQIWPWDGPGDAMFIARFIHIPDEL